MESGEGLITVIVPIYNGEDFLDRCVRSILGQTYKNLEVLLIDGGSTDNTAQLCRSFCEKDKRVHFLPEKENLGVSASRNHGLREAKGAYITFVDADDWLKKDCLERLSEDIRDTGAQVAGCSFCCCTDEQQGDAEENRETTESERRVLRGEDFLRDGILKRDTRCWSKLYLAESIQGCSFREDYTIGEDMLFLFDVAAKVPLISTSTYEGYCYYRNPKGAMLKPFRKSDMDQIRCWQEILETVRREENPAGETICNIATIQIVSCILVAGKLALLSGEERAKYTEQLRQCRQSLKETLRIKGAYRGLDRGYRVKTLLFRYVPGWYLFLYHTLKKGQREAKA